MFRDEENVAQALAFLGYGGGDGARMLRRFQRHWNRVSLKISGSPGDYQDIPFPLFPQGILKVDGDIGPHTLNALEIAIVNQRESADWLAWEAVIALVKIVGNGRGKQKLYNAAQGM